MPIATIGIGLGTALAGGAAAGATIYGANKASGASKRAASTQSRADAEAIAFERERDAEAKRQWDIEQANLAEQRNYDRRLMEEREARLAPYRATSAAALGKLGDMLGIQVPAMPTDGGGAPMGGAPMRIPGNNQGINPGGMYGRGPLTRVEPMPQDVPMTLGAQLHLRSRRPIDLQEMR